MRSRWIYLSLALLLVLSGCVAVSPRETKEPPQSFSSFPGPEEGTAGESSPPEPVTQPTEPSEPPVPETLPPPPPVIPDPEEFVNVTEYLPDIQVELRYATEDNFTGQVIYSFQDAYLRYGTVEKLAQVQSELAQLGYGLKIWDAFRPVAAQFKLWEVYPDPNFVANPNYGYSNHSRGNTLDVTLVWLATGEEVEMPTGFDDFSAYADRDYSDCTPEAAEHARLLESVMKSHGFSPYYGEWWHFSNTQSYPVETEWNPKKMNRWHETVPAVLLVNILFPVNLTPAGHRIPGRQRFSDPGASNQ